MASRTGAAPIRVLYVISTLEPVAGGPSVSAPNIWLSARRAGIDATVAAPVDPSNPGEAETLARLEAEGLAVRAFAPSRIRRFRRWGVSLPLALSLLRTVPDFDIVHAHGAWTFTSLTALAAAHARRRPFVLTPHESLTDSDIGKGASGSKHRVKAYVRSLYAKLAAAIVVASATEARASLGADAAARGEVIYHPVIGDAAALPLPRTGWSAPGALRLGYLGRFDPKKNLDLVIAVAASLPAVTLAIAGGGDPPYEARLRRIAEESGAESRIRWLGFIAGRERPAFFAGIDVLVMPSNFEGFGMVAAEAMAQGVPVIVSQASGIGELVCRYDCGLVIPATRDGLRGAIEPLLADPSRLDRWSEHALEACRRELTFAQYGARLSALYRDLASAPRRGFGVP